MSLGLVIERLLNPGSIPELAMGFVSYWKNLLHTKSSDSKVFYRLLKITTMKKVYLESSDW